MNAITSEQAARMYREQAANADAAVRDAESVLAAGGHHMPNGDVAMSVRANSINDREDALTEMYIHANAPTRRRENAAAVAYRLWLVDHPGDFNGATNAGAAAYEA